jgi:hypothetical protein
MTSQAKRKPRKRARSLPSRPTTTGGHVRRTSVDSGTPTKVRTVLGESTPTIQVLDTIEPGTGPVLEVPKPVVVRPKKKLDQLYMDTGSLDTLLPDSDWSDIATDLWVDYAVGLGPKQDKLAELCTVYYKAGKEAQTKEKPASKDTEQVPRVVAFLEKFMEANGQWDYIRDQDWYKKDGYVIGIEVNYYANRLGSGALPGFHKDTAGDNVFVNLIFDNTDTIEGTEWFADVEKPGKTRKAWQKGVLPESYRTDLNRARKDISAKTGKDEDVHGGTVGSHAYVSWVDDLVWHATPTAVPRIVYGVQDAIDSYDALDSSVDSDGFGFVDPVTKANVYGRAIIASMAESPGPYLFAWLNRNNLKPQDIDDAQAKKAWKELYGGNTEQSFRRYHSDTKARAKLPWRLTGDLSEASAPDDSLKGSKSITEIPVGLSKRRRANSLPASTELAEVRAKNTPRNFLRTWVRVLPPTTKVTGIDLT